MPSACADSLRHTFTRTFFFVLLVLASGCFALTGCKKDQNEPEAGDVSSSASIISVPAEITAQEEQATRPSADMKGLAVHIVPAESPITALPDMVPVQGMDISVRISPRMKNTAGWTQYFATLYKPVNDCIDRVDGGAAYVASVKQDGSSGLHVQIVGLDNHTYSCRIPVAGGRASAIEETEQDAVIDGAAFYPRSAGRPLTDNPQCYAMESVVARPGGLIGWLAFPLPDCAIGTP